MEDRPDPPVELTASETLVWAGQRLAPGEPLYNMALGIEITGPLDVAAFRRAFTRLVDESDALRTVVREERGRPLRVVLDRAPSELEVREVPTGQVPEEELAAHLVERTQRMFVLEEALFDAALLRRGPERHVWYLNQHHLVTDAWSVGVLHRRLSALYAEEEGTGPRDGEALPPFSEFVRFEQSLRDGVRLERARQHWRTQPAPQPLRIYGNPGPGCGRTRRVRVALGEQRAARLAQVAASAPFRALTSEQSRFLVFATVLSAWLHRTADLRGVAIGTPWHNRATARQRATPGLFIELYPLHLQLADDETFASLAAKASGASQEALRHVVPGASAEPGARAFEVVLNYITANLGSFAGRPARADWVHSGFGDRAHKLRLQVHDFDLQGGPTLDFDLDEALFGDREREWVVRHFLTLFDALLATPERRLADVALTPWAEEATFARPGTTTDPAPTVPAQFRVWVERSPGALAVQDGARRLTYGELGASVTALAHQLRTTLPPGEPVGLCFERSADLVIAVLGALEAGVAYVPLDPAYPDARLGSLAADAGVTRVVADPAFHARIQAWSGVPLALPPAEPDVPPAPPPRDTLAYVLYTSGSTGRPKGVEVGQGALADYVAWAARRYTDGERLSFPLFTSPAFDLTVTSLLVPLVSGGRVVVYRDTGNSGLLVRRVFDDDLVDVVKLTPAHLGLLRDLDLSGSRVRRLILGGEDLKVGTARAAWEALGGRAEILNEYGPTEATVGCTLHRYDPSTDTVGSVPIGTPADDVRIHVLDAGLRPVPRGAEGEICIAGRRLARGYRGVAPDSDSPFVSDPQLPAQRLYRTGDRGRWSATGPLEFLGRRDDQVKVRGVRIELAEVEAALGQHPDVAECVAHLSSVGVREAWCTRCGLAAAHPEAHLDAEGVCAVCRQFEHDRERVASYFGTPAQLQAILDRARSGAPGPHDCIMLYSGGKDSTYALCRIVEMGARPLVFLLDNGFISDQAKENVRRVVDLLGLDLVIGETPAMSAVFADSLHRYSNVCNGCFKVIYTLATKLAIERGLSHVVTGLSRGQIFETRLHDLYRRGIYEPAAVDRTILEARKAYHRMDDAVSRNLATEIFADDAVFERIQFVDFYRYCDDTLDEILSYVAERTPWVRPSDTGRSTNCLINEAGIWVHTRERGFHNYAMPYSWDVRLGHKQRDAALAELDDELDPGRVRAMLDQVGYRERPAAEAEGRLVAYYTAPSEVPVPTLRRFLEERLPGEMIPSAFVRLESLPLTRNGKVDRAALPQPDAQRPVLEGAFVAPRTDAERVLAAVWRAVLGLDAIGVHDNFFELGGDSMQCIQIVTVARDRGFELLPHQVFEHPTVATLALAAEGATRRRRTTAAGVSAEEMADLLDEFGE